MKVCEAVRDLRMQMDLTQAEFAARLCLSTASVAHFETGARVPDPGSMLLLCRAAFSDARRIDLADVFANALPGVTEGLLIPCWQVKPMLSLPPQERALSLPPQERALTLPPQERMVTVRLHQGNAEEMSKPQRSRARRFRDRRSRQ